MYIKFTSHPKSLDGTCPPFEDMLREFCFSKVNMAIANALTVINNSKAATMSKSASLRVTLEYVTNQRRNERILDTNER